MKQLAIIILLSSHFCFSQRIEKEYGKLTKEEIDMTQYAKDPEAKAVILYDKGNSVFFDTDNGYDIRFTRHKRIKIFDNTETQYTEVSIPYYVDGYGKTEKVHSIDAITFNIVDGKVSSKRLNPSAVFEERINERWYNKKFVFPDVQNGAILEYRYTFETFRHGSLPDWTFQDKIPTIYSEYQVSMIPFYEYIYLVQGISKFDYQNSVLDKTKRSWGNVSKSHGKNVGSGIEFQDYVHTYVLKDVPAFNDEAYITSENDYLIKMDFQLAKLNHPYGGSDDVLSTWPELNEELLKYEWFGKYLKSCAKVAKKILAEDLNLDGLSDQEKSKEIANYTKNSFEWNGYISKYASQSAKEFVTRKTGNAADINLFMIALLNEAGLNTKPLILSTRSHGKIPYDYPFDHFTNYVIAFIDIESPILADGTEDLLAFNKLPERCFNEKGLVVEKDDNPRWIELKNNVHSIQNSVIRIEINGSSMNAETTVSIQNTEYEANKIRNQFRNDEEKIKDYYTKKIGEIRKTKATGYQRTDLPYSIHFESTYETEKLAENVVFQPFLNLPISSHGLSQKKRAYPVDFIYPWENRFESTIIIPAGFTVSEIPEGYSLENELAEVKLNYELDDQNLTVKGNYWFKKSIYMPSEYSRIKYYMNQIVKYFNQNIVLEKK